MRLSWYTREIPSRGKETNFDASECIKNNLSPPATVTATPTKRLARIFHLRPNEIFHQHRPVPKSKSLFHLPRAKACYWQIAPQCHLLDEPSRIKSKFNGIWSVLWLTFCVRINLCWFLYIFGFLFWHLRNLSRLFTLHFKEFNLNCLIDVFLYFL